MWIKLDDNFSTHPKVLSVGPLAGWLHVCGLVYCGRHLTDGKIPDAALGTLATFDHISVSYASVGAGGGEDPVAEFCDEVKIPDLVARLVEVGLWIRVADGYVIHDYLQYNPSREDVLLARQKGADRVKRSRERRFARNNGVTNADVSGEVRRESQRPDPSPEEQEQLLPLPPVGEGQDLKDTGRAGASSEAAQTETHVSWTGQLIEEFHAIPGVSPDRRYNGALIDLAKKYGVDLVRQTMRDAAGPIGKAAQPFPFLAKIVSSGGYRPGGPAAPEDPARTWLRQGLRAISGGRAVEEVAR